VIGQKYRNELLIKITPRLGELSLKIMMDVKIRTDEAIFKAVVCVTTLSAQHDAVVFLHWSRLF
jgi:hypothetical protein